MFLLCIYGHFLRPKFEGVERDKPELDTEKYAEHIPHKTGCKQMKQYNRYILWDDRVKDDQIQRMVFSECFFVFFLFL